MGVSSKLFVLSLILFSTCLCSSAMDVSYDSRAITINGDRKLIISGSIHYPRSTPGMWKDLIQKAKDGGLNAIETYVFWNAHEPRRREYDFSGNLDLVRFIKTIQDTGLYAILRIGPYVCAEWNYGGFPVWLHNMPGVDHLRTTNSVYLDEMRTFTTLIVDTMRHENLFASQGGPIIIAQIENEFGNVASKYGDGAKDYVNWCAKLALNYNIDIPWIMCQQNDAPDQIISTCNGYYCDSFKPKENTPKIWTENWTGWFKDWGMKDPHRTAEDLAYAVARFFQLGGTVQNYYMYHGGTNFGRSSGGPYITTSYDYDAPLDEYGNLNQPKWGHLKQLHLLLRSMEKILTYGSVQQITYDDNSSKSATIYNYEGKQACFLGNSGDEDLVFELYEHNYTVPAWSVSILPDCYTEAYNTAKVNSQTSIFVKKDNEADDGIEPYGLKWKWTSEYMEHLHKGLIRGGDLIAPQLLDQKVVTNDTSDYLWYMTSFESLGTKKATLRVHTNGHLLHAFINGRHVGSDYSRDTHGFTFERRVKLHPGVNSLSLLSITVGLPNYGEFFDTWGVGIDGPVELIATKKDNWTKTLDLSSNQWVYKVGMHGDKIGLHQQNHRNNYLWRTTNLPTNKKFTWYKTTFKTPLGSDPVVVDLMGMDKGVAWVNGNNIGRYWTTFLATEDGCSSNCDYRNKYEPNKCLTNCGKPSQRWYHVPRSFLKEDMSDNTLVLFEEMGGNPGLIKFQTVTVEKACADAYEGNVLELSCQGSQVVTQVRFASFGEPQGTCGSFTKGTCEAPNAKSVVEEACLGQQSCSLDVSEAKLGPTGCHAETYRLAVEVVCGSSF